MIIGFPGETEDDFQQTCSTAEACGFSKMHLFPFSPRRGTPAADMPDQVHGEVKHARREHLAEIEARLRLRYFESLVGQRLTMLVESSETPAGESVSLGTACRYAPIAVHLAGDRSGELVEVIGKQATAERIEAVCLP